MPAIFLTRYEYCNILDRLFHIATAMAATPFQADQQNAANTQKILRARQAVENREKEGCVYSIPLSDLIGKLLEMQYNEINDSASISSTVPVAVEWRPFLTKLLYVSKNLPPQLSFPDIGEGWRM